MRCHMLRVIMKYAQDCLRKPIEILHKQSILLDIEFKMRFVMDDMIDSLLEAKAYGAGEKDKALPEFLTETENPNLSDL